MLSFRRIAAILFFLVNAHAREWSDSSRWLYNSLAARFADVSGNYQSALHSALTLAKESKQVELFRYAYDLALADSNFTQAETIAREWLSIYPEDNEAELALLRILFANKQKDEIYKYSVDLLNRDGSPQVVAQLSRITSDYSDDKDKLTYFQSISDKFPKNPYVHYYRGLIAKEQGFVNTALEAFNNARQLTTSWRQLELMQAEVLSGVGKLQEAEEILRKMQHEHPNNIEIISANIDILTDHQQWNKALILAEKWARLQPKSPQILHILAWLNTQNGDYEAALPLYEQLREKGEIDTNTFNFHMAQTAKNSNLLALAKELFTKVDETSPLFILSQQELALLALKQGDHAAAHKKFNELRQIFPKEGLNFFILEINQMRFYKQDVNELIKQAAKDYGTSSDIQLILAEEKIQEKDYAAAEGIFTKIIKETPDFVEAISSYGNFLLTQPNRFKEADNLISSAISAYPNIPLIQDSYAQVLARKGNIKEALNWQRRAYSVYRSGNIIARYVDLLAQANESAWAREVFNYGIQALPQDSDLQKIGKKLDFL